MNKEQKKFKKVIKARVKRRKFDRRQNEAKVKKDRILKKEKVVYKFDKLEKKIKREKYIRDNPPVSQIMSPQISPIRSPRKII